MSHGDRNLLVVFRWRGCHGNISLLQTSSSRILPALSNFCPGTPIPVIAAVEFVLYMQAVSWGAHHVNYSLLLLVAIFWGNCQQFLKQQIGNSKKIEEIVLQYRKIQISERIHNSIFRTRIFLPLMCALPLIQVLSGVAFLTLFHSESWFSLAVFLLAYLESWFADMLSVTAGSVIYTKTNEWILGCRGWDGKRSYGRKVLKSFRPLRLEFGNNYIDRLTPLVMQEFCIRNTASILLLSGAGNARNLP